MNHQGNILSSTRLYMVSSSHADISVSRDIQVATVEVSSSPSLPHHLVLLSLRLRVVMRLQSALDLFPRLTQYHIAKPMRVMREVALRIAKGSEVFMV